MAVTEIDEWNYQTSEAGTDLFVFLQANGRRKFSENPSEPERELLDFLEESESPELLLMPPCSSKTLEAAVKSVDRLIVIDHNENRLRLFETKNPDVKCFLVREECDLRIALADNKNLLERAKVRAYMPSRYSRLDPVLNKILYVDLLNLQKEYASFAASRSLKRWHTNTNLLLNLKNLKSYLTEFPKLHCPFVIVGAGPSLDLTVQSLKIYEKKAIIIATDGSLQSLCAHGIKPDFIVSAEDTLMSWRFFAGQSDFLKDVPLVMSSKANNLLLREYSGPVVLTKESSGELWAGPFVEDLPLLECGRCVGHMAYNLAIACGCSEIIMTGFDLAYRGERFHPEDMPVPYYHGMVEPDLQSVEGHGGQFLKTDITMKTFLRDFEWMIKNTDVPVYDATEGGALKKGTKVKTLSESLSQLPDIGQDTNLHFRNYFQKEINAYCQNFMQSSEFENYDRDFVAPFGSYLIQESKSLPQSKKDEDLRSSKEYLKAIIKCPVHKGFNQALFVDTHADEDVLLWAEEQGLCIYTPKDLVEALHLCEMLELSRIYCCDSFIDPDLLLLTDIDVVDIKTSTGIKPYERCLWSPRYQVFLKAEVAEFWRQNIPEDIKITEMNCEFQDQELLYGIS